MILIVILIIVMGSALVEEWLVIRSELALRRRPDARSRRLPAASARPRPTAREPWTVA